MPTQTKIIRKYAQIKTGAGYRYIKRPEVLPPLPMKSKECPVCGDEMLVADGQLMRMHKACKRELSKTRKDYKKDFKDLT